MHMKYLPLLLKKGEKKRKNVFKFYKMDSLDWQMCH